MHGTEGEIGNRRTTKSVTNVMRVELAYEQKKMIIIKRYIYGA